MGQGFWEGSLENFWRRGGVGVHTLAGAEPLVCGGLLYYNPAYEVNQTTMKSTACELMRNGESVFFFLM